MPSYTSRRSLLNLIVGGAVWVGCDGVRPAHADPFAAPEGLSAPEGAAVAAILDGNTLLLKDGRQVRLVGIETPRPDLAPDDARLVELAAGAKAALAVSIGGRPISLRFDSARRDRYDRLLAHAFNADGQWLQGIMVGSGMARVHGDGSNRLGLRTLLELEAKARSIFWGIWAHPAFDIRAADDPKLERLAGSFQIVQGRVFAAATVDRTGFINFGTDRHTDLTLVLKNSAMDLGGPSMLDLGWLTAKPIRCRGWLDLHDGPNIDISHAEQIELLET